MTFPRLPAALIAVAVLASACAPQPGGVATSLQSTTAPTSRPTTTTTVRGQEVIGVSVEGRDIVAITIGSGPQRLYLVGGIHGDERPAVENAPAILDHLRGLPPAEWTVRFVIDANPDGTAANTRDNARGVDLNRNWPSEAFTPSASTGPAPLSEPETAALAADIASFQPDLIVAMHAAREGPFVESDGPGEAWARWFAAGASSVGREWQVVPEVDWSTVGSMGTYFGDEGRIPVITVEANRWDSPLGVTTELLAGLDALLSADVEDTAPAAPCEDHEIGVTCAGPTASAHGHLHDGTSGGVHGFIVKEVGGPVLAAVNADTRFYPASVIKLVHLAHALRAFDARTASPSDPVTMPADGCSGTGGGPTVPLDALLDRMMQQSDNAAANAIQAHFGLDALEETIAAADMAGTRLVHGFGCGGPANDPANTITAVDLVRLLEGLADGSLVSPDGWARAEATMLDGGAALGVEGEPPTGILIKEGWYGTTLTIAGIATVTGEAGPTVLVFAAFTDGADAVTPEFAITDVARLLVFGP